jgi:hypothetical protein
MHPPSSSFLRVIAFLAPFILFFILARPCASAKEKEEPILRPPSPQPVVVSAYVGERTAIDLTLRGRIEDPATILIRKKPRFGLLSDPERLNRQTWRVWYSAPSDAPETLDSFTYAAKSVDSPVSVATPVQVSIIKRAAQLVFSESLDFGSVPVGETSTKQFDIRNAGGKTATIDPALRPPWELLDPAPIQIKGGETKKIHVAFSPASPGVYAEKFVLERDSKRGITLNAASGNPLQWPSQGVLFASGQRASAQSVSFRNLTDKARELIFEWPDFLDAPSHITINPDSSMEVPIRLQAEPAFSWNSTVPFSSANFKGWLAVVIETAPARIILEPASVLDLGEVPLGNTAKGTLQISNSGGRPARLSIDVPKGLKATPPSTELLLEPSMSTCFEVSVTPQKVGIFDFLLPVYSDSEPFGNFGVRVSARSAQPVERVLSIPPPIVSPKIDSPAADIPPVQECFLLDSTAHSVSISWQLPSPDAKGFLIERREIKQGADGQVEQIWKKWEGVDIQISGDSATAHFRKLPPGTFWSIRLSAVDSQGRVSSRSPGHFRIETKPINLFKIPFWIWAPLSIVAIALLVFFFKKHIRFASEDLDERIAKLGK